MIESPILILQSRQREKLRSNPTAKAFPTTTFDARFRLGFVVSALLLPVENERQNVEGELGDIQTKPFKFLFSLMTQNVASLRPERSHGLPDRLIV